MNSVLCSRVLFRFTNIYFDIENKYKKMHDHVSELKCIQITLYTYEFINLWILDPNSVNERIKP